MFPLIKLVNVTKYYKLGFHKVKALNNVNLEINKGEFISVIGPSGSGKSTLLNIIGCLDKPSEGQVFIENLNVTELKDKKLSELRAEKIGFVFQTFNLIPSLTAKENVELVSSFSSKIKNSEERALELLKLVGLEKRAHHKPSELSGGEQQRVAIARALMNNPEIILADEPTGNLDTKTSNEIVKIFSNLNKLKKTIIIVTHNMQIANKTNKIIHLRDGEIVNEVKKSV